MSYKHALIPVLALTSAIAFAEPEPPAADPAEAFVVPEQSTEAQKLEAHCKSLQQKMKELKNRPLQRSAVADRYKLECQDAPYGGR